MIAVEVKIIFNKASNKAYCNSDLMFTFVNSSNLMFNETFPNKEEIL
jgi:hypothetical protein